MKHLLPKPSILLAAVLGLSLASLSVTPQSACAAAKSKAKSASAKKMAAGRGESGVKVSRDEAIKSPKAHKPPTKGGMKSRGGWGVIDFDNYSGDYADCYVDGVYVGTVAPYGDLYDDEPSGSHTLAGVDDADNGTWGPRDIYLGSSFTWRMND